MKILFVALASLVFIVACGDDKGKNDSANDSSKHSMFVADAGALPTCDAASEGWIMYVKATSALKACTGGAWIDAPIAAPVGADSGIEAQWYCPGATLDLSTDPNETLTGISMTVTKFKNGDYFSSCLSGVRAANGDSDSVDGSTFHPKSTVTTSELLCVSLASVTFNIDTSKAKYFDSLDPTHNQEVACTKR